MHYSRIRTVRCRGRWGGGVSQHALGRGVCIPACTGQGGVSQYALGGGCLPRGVSDRGVSAQGGCLPRGGVAEGKYIKFMQINFIS